MYIAHTISRKCDLHLIIIVVISFLINFSFQNFNSIDYYIKFVTKYFFLFLFLYDQIHPSLLLFFVWV